MKRFGVSSVFRSGIVTVTACGLFADETRCNVAEEETHGRKAASYDDKVGFDETIVGVRLDYSIAAHGRETIHTNT